MYYTSLLRAVRFEEGKKPFLKQWISYLPPHRPPRQIDPGWLTLVFLSTRKREKIGVISPTPEENSIKGNKASGVGGRRFETLEKLITDPKSLQRTSTPRKQSIRFSASSNFSNWPYTRPPESLKNPRNKKKLLKNPSRHQTTKRDLKNRNRFHVEPESTETNWNVI